MKMSHREALKVLGLVSGVGFDEIKTTYRRLSAKYHPDRNPAGLEMMKMINAAWQALSDYAGEKFESNGNDEQSFNADEYSEAINEALNKIINLGLEIEICGSWIWVSGDTKAHKDVLKEAGFRWAPKKLMWSFNPSPSKRRFKSNYSMDEIRNAHGSVRVRSSSYERIASV